MIIIQPFTREMVCASEQVLDRLQADMKQFGDVLSRLSPSAQVPFVYILLWWPLCSESLALLW